MESIEKLSKLENNVEKGISNLLAQHAGYHDLEEIISTPQSLYETHELSEVEKRYN
ncbi:hypothetical protein [Anaerobacillus alkaliphilus]|uniref:hypothetical protein n=1 Tax=Anaerobacillus alkaliphilus TaxID=1548597 RepID=UPI001376324B|nr:hypothetical protein [Anaerobacillus alkaliphilus]